jgi:hypothetical protein
MIPLIFRHLPDGLGQYPVLNFASLLAVLGVGVLLDQLFDPLHVD